jgi:hypothetical protein
MINAPTAIPILLPNLSENQASMGKEAICPTDWIQLKRPRTDPVGELK